MRALKKHCQTPWILLYVERWLKAPMQTADGELLQRTRGTPQGGVVSPLLANLFLHYAFDVWVTRNLTSVRFCRYADDGVVHCKSLAQAKLALRRIGARFGECGLELHPGKTRIVYCKDVNRPVTHPDVQFTFLGYTFSPPKAVDKYQRVYVNFAPAVSRDALKAMRQTIRGWHQHLQPVATTVHALCRRRSAPIVPLDLPDHRVHFAPQILRGEFPPRQETRDRVVTHFPVHHRRQARGAGLVKAGNRKTADRSLFAAGTRR